MSTSNDTAQGGLYVHVPFCARKCDYCAFYSEAVHPKVVQRYVDALIREMDRVRFQPRTVFFGGGTPSLLTLAQWEQIFAAMHRRGLMGAREWTIECNPATVSLDKARLWHDHGVNRVSMGVQSTDEGLLDRLGRVHSRENVFKSFELLRRSGFQNINLDLMFAIPNQTLEIWQATLAEVIALQSEHLACYELIYEEDTPLFVQLQAREFEVDEDLACAMYDLLVEKATEAGLLQYEVANFARNEELNPWPDRLPRYACRHNVNYWRGGSFQGLGPSASSFVDGLRTKNWSNTEIYCQLIEQDKRAVESEDPLSPLARAGEIAAFGLRMPAGWDYGAFQATTGFDLRVEWREEIEELVERKWGERAANRFSLTPLGLRFADAAGEFFLR